MKKIRIFSLVLVIFMIMQLMGCAVSIPIPSKVSSEDEAQAIGLSVVNDTETIRVGEYKQIDFDVKIDYNYALKWESDNPAVATVDSNGRVDGISVGEATITATAEEASIEVKVIVKEEKKRDNKPVNHSTALTANEETEKRNKESKLEDNLYRLLIDMGKGRVIAYTYNSDGTYNRYVRIMACSVAKESKMIYEYGDDDDKVIYHVGKKSADKDGWSGSADKFYRYTTPFSVDNGDSFNFTSCEYSKKDPSALVTSEYNKLGTAFTGGDIRLSADDAKWIYDNCNEGTEIRFVEYEKNITGIPKTVKIGEKSPYQNWDPTDPDKNNPYHKSVPTFENLGDLHIKEGDVCDLTKDIVVYDSCMNDITKSVVIDGSIPRDKAGCYIVTYKCEDIFGRTAQTNRKIYVEK